MKLVNHLLLLVFLTNIAPVFALTLEGNTSQSAFHDERRATPYISINFGGRMIDLGQDAFPCLDDCQFYCLGKNIYVYRKNVFMGIIDKSFAFKCADKVVLGLIIPQPDASFAANKDEVEYISSKVYCSND